MNSVRRQLKMPDTLPLHCQLIPRERLLDVLSTRRPIWGMAIIDIAMACVQTLLCCSGEIGIDDALVKLSSQEEIIEMNNGCICCTGKPCLSYACSRVLTLRICAALNCRLAQRYRLKLDVEHTVSNGPCSCTPLISCFLCCAVRGDLVRILHKLLNRRAKFDYIIIETTGLADPAPVAQTFFVDEGLQQHLKLDAIVTVVDAKHVHQHLDEKKPEGVENEVSPDQMCPAAVAVPPCL